VGNESAIIPQVTVWEREVDKTGMGRGAESTNEEIVISMIYMTRLVLGSAQNNYRPKRISESLRETDAVRVGHPITTGYPLGNLSSRTVDCRVVPIERYVHLLCRPPDSGMNHNIDQELCF
jgi:hypothetical protein